MENIKDIRDGISKLEKSISLRQVAIRSGINYITLRNIKYGKSNRVTGGVLERFNEFYDSFNPKEETTPIRRGRKAKKAVAKKAVKASPGKKRGRPKKAAAKKVTVKTAAALPFSNLTQEIARTEAHLASLKKLEQAYKEYLKSIAK